ncbi:DUF6303 family protein [Streptomyces sp. NPDC001780]
MRGFDRLTAQMSRTANGAHWVIYVQLLGEGEWPKVVLPAHDTIPAIATRTDILARLGYEPATPYPFWQWIETGRMSESASPVELVATVPVVPIAPERRAATRGGAEPHGRAEVHSHTGPRP